MNKQIIMSAVGILVIGSSITGCATTTAEHTPSAASNYTATSPRDVKILFEKPERKYEVLGYVSGRGTAASTTEDVFNAMKDEASKLGANAILVRSDVQKEDDSFFKKGSALAIRWMK
jgi:hypothetical protein